MNEWLTRKVNLALQNMVKFSILVSDSIKADIDRQTDRQTHRQIDRQIQTDARETDDRQIDNRDRQTVDSVCTYFQFFIYSAYTIQYVVRAKFHQLCVTLATLWTVARQAPLSMGFPRQEHWSGLPFPPPGDLPHPGIESESPVFLALQADFFLPLSHQKSPSVFVRFSRMSMYDFTITF